MSEDTLYISLQNPRSCNTTRKIKCVVHQCGFGCQTNTVGLCLMIGYATNRTVIVEPSMTSLIHPLSTTCTSAVGKNSTEKPKWGEGELSLSLSLCLCQSLKSLAEKRILEESQTLRYLLFILPNFKLQFSILYIPSFT